MDGEQREHPTRGSRLARVPLRHLAPRADGAPALLGRQVHRALRRRLHPAEARLRTRQDHHTQVAAAGCLGSH